MATAVAWLAALSGCRTAPAPAPAAAPRSDGIAFPNPCRAPSAGVPGPPAAGAALPRGAERAFRTPERWFQPSPELEAYLDWLDDSPYRTADAFHRIADLVVFDGALWLGLGDLDANPGSRYCAHVGGACDHEDAPGHGLPVLRVAPGEARATVDAVLREERIGPFRRVGDALWAMASDATEGDGPLACQEPGAEPACPEEDAWPRDRHHAGAVHRRGPDGWSDVPLAVFHQLDLAADPDGSVLLGGSAPIDDHHGGPTVWRLAPGGGAPRVLRQERGIDRRVTAVVRLGEVHVVAGYTVDAPEPLRWVGRGDAFTDAPGLLPELAGAVRVELVDEGLALAWSATGPATILTAPDGVPESRAAPFADEGEVVRAVDLLCRRDLLVLLDREGADGVVHHRVVRTADLERADTLLAWDGGDAVFGLAWFDGALVFGADDGWLLRSPARAPPRGGCGG